MDEQNDVIIIGGGPAGLSAALPLARSRRSVLVADTGEPRNAAADGVHNYLGREGTPPADLLAIGREELARYGVHRTTRPVVDVRPEPQPVGGDPVAFRVSFADGGTSVARRVVVAAGAVDVLPAVPGLAEQWGRGVVHCPYCHGWEVRDRHIGVLMTSPMAAHQVQLFRQLSDRVTAFVTDPAVATAEARLAFRARGVRVVDGPVAGVESSSGGTLTGVRLVDGTVVPVDAVAVASTVEARIGFLSGLGLVPEDVVMQGVRVGSVLPVDPMGRTTVPGVWAAGNVTNVPTIVIGAAAAGVGVGAQVHAELVAADIAVALGQI